MGKSHPGQNQNHVKGNSGPAEVNESLNRAEVSLCLQQAPAPVSQKNLLKQEQAAHGSNQSQALPMFIFLAQPQLCQLLLCALCWPVLPPVSSHVLPSLPIPNCSAMPLRALNPLPRFRTSSGLYLLPRMFWDHFRKASQQCETIHQGLLPSAPDRAVPILAIRVLTGIRDHRLGDRVSSCLLATAAWKQPGMGSLRLVQAPHVIH